MSILPFRRFLCWLTVSLTLFAGCASIPAFAYDQPEQDDKAAAATGVEFQPRLGTFHYEIQWVKTRVATSTVTIERDGEFFRLTADQKSTKFLDRIYRIRYRGATQVNVQDLSPDESIIHEEVKKRKKKQETSYDAQSKTATVVETRSKNDQAAVQKKTYELKTDSGIVDVFSAIFLARSFDWSVGERHQFLIFIGEKQYQVTMDCIGMSKLSVVDTVIPVYIIRPGIRRTDKAKESKIAKKTTIYISADESKDIVKVKSESGYGTVYLRLVEYQEN
jgi:hypothetical protein